MSFCNRFSFMFRFLFCAVMLMVFVIICIVHSLRAEDSTEDAYPKFFHSYAKPLLVPRPPGSENSAKIVKFLDDTLSSMGYDVHRQSFVDRDPTKTEYNFTNVWTETNSKLPKLVFACHHDSKVIPQGSQKGRSEFVGAIDSSIPCAILLQLAQVVSSASGNECGGIAETKKQFSFVFLFFDGEEAFYEWTDTDSLYGSRYFASHIDKTQPGFIRKIKMFTLLDLLGAQSPTFRQTADSGSDECYRRLMGIEMDLRENNQPKNAPCYDNKFEFNAGDKKYFTSYLMGTVSDDHLPFLKQKVPVLHLIPVPFPKVWHTMQDNEQSLHHPTIENILSILIQFINNGLLSCVNN